MPDYASSVQAVALRLTRLGASGAPVSGSNSSYVTRAFVSLSFTPEYQDGDEISVTAADGSNCVYYKVPDTLKRVNFELAICSPQPEIYELLAGGSILAGAGANPTYTVTNKALTTNVATLTTSATHAMLVGDSITVTGVDAVFNGTYIVTAVTSTTVSYAKTATSVTTIASPGSVSKTENLGWAAPVIGSAPGTNGVSIEAWSRAIVGGRPAAVNPFFRFVFPYVQTRLSGDRVLENGALANVFTGFGLGNSAWATGPALDWTFPTTSALSFARAATAPNVEGFAVVA